MSSSNNTTPTSISCTEVVHRDCAARLIAQMLNDRYTKGWLLDRIIDHMHADTLVYYFRIDPKRDSRLPGF